MNRIYSAFLSSVLASMVAFQCATIEKLDKVSLRRSAPQLVKFQEEIPAPTYDQNDHKIRKKNKSTPDLILVALESDWKEYSAWDRDFFGEEFSRRIQASGIKLTENRVIFTKDTLSLRPMMKKKDIDAYICISPTEENALAFQISVLDSVNETNYGELRAEWSMPKEEEDSLLIFWNRKSHIEFVPKLRFVPKELVSFPGESEWKSVVSKSVQGTLNLYASSSDTVVKVNGTVIGEVPIQELTVLNGPNRVEFSKPGLEPVVRSVQMRAGQVKNIIHEWEDDRSTSSLVVQSFPQGLDVWVDNDKKGKSQQYLTEIMPGDYRIRLSKSFPQDRGVVEEYLFAEGVLSLPPKKLESIALPYLVEEALHPNQAEFWKPIGNRGFIPGITPKLSFAKKTKLMPGDYGYISSYFFLDELVVQGTFPEEIPKNHHMGILFYTSQRVFVLEARGESIALFELGLNQKSSTSLGVWKFKEKIKPEDRIFRIETYPKKKEIRFRLGNREIFRTEFLESGFSRLGLVTRGEAFFEGMPLRDLKIFYPDMVELEKNKEKK